MYITYRTLKKDHLGIKTVTLKTLTKQMTDILNICALDVNVV